jgi:FixJ family two-component response regulator
MMGTNGMVFVVDDDAPMRESLRNLIRSVGLRVELFSSAQEFLESNRPDVPSCLVLDVRLPGLSGLDLQRRTTEARIEIPIIFITGYGDIPMTVGAMKAGAVEFLSKPFRDQDLLDAIQEALERDRKARDQRAALEELRSRFASLTPREREVMARVVAGLLNKQIGVELGMSETTVKIHRHQVMDKMRAGSLPELVRMADKLGIPVPKSQLPVRKRNRSFCPWHYSVFTSYHLLLTSRRGQLIAAVSQPLAEQELENGATHFRCQIFPSFRSSTMTTPLEARWRI